VSHPERIVPDDTEPGIVAIHLKRYEFARPLCAERDVLDAACGVGYGTAYLAGEASRVVGVDVDADAIAYARRRYARPNVEFVQQDLAELDLPDDSFDVVVSFETIEHLARPDAFLEHAARVLRAGGVFVVSTPHVEKTTTSPANPFHTLELSRDDFQAMLSRHFGAVELYGQHRIQTRRHRLMQRADVLGLRKRLPFVRRASRVVAGTPAMDEVTADKIEISRDALDSASELVAVCRP
jgi:2-polyprenyl-3-methyl-5-hydroxy-6-metoxy-1,4-benzoquinol methylase